MSEMQSVDGILDVIKSITSNRESGRLEINSFGTSGTFLFNDGKLVDARLGSLSGFQAVNAAVGLRAVAFSFDHVLPASHVSTITANERVVLQQFFGIEAAESERPSDLVEPDPEWNTSPEQVVPFTELEEVPQTDLEETPTVEVEPPLAAHSVGPAVLSHSAAGARRFAFVWRPRLALAMAVCLALVASLAAAAIALRTKMKAQQQPTLVAKAVETAPAVETKPGATPDTQREAVSEAQQQPAEQSVAASQRQSKPVAKDSPAPALARAERRDTPAERVANVQDLTGEWRVINTVEKTAYKSFGNMQVGFRLKIDQRGNEFTASGEKFSENGQTLAAGSRTPIHVHGSIDGDKVVATFIEEGRTRRSNGSFIWKLQRGGEALAGTFVTTAANSSGKSAVTRQ